MRRSGVWASRDRDRWRIRMRMDPTMTFSDTTSTTTSRRGGGDRQYGRRGTASKHDDNDDDDGDDGGRLRPDPDRGRNNANHRGWRDKLVAAVRRCRRHRRRRRRRRPSRECRTREIRPTTTWRSICTIHRGRICIPSGNRCRRRRRRRECHPFLRRRPRSRI
jgi:hypothetical protein